LQPDLLRDIANEALAPYFDSTLDGRVRAAKTEWIARVQAIVDAHTDTKRMARIRVEAARKLAELVSEIARLREASQIDLDDFNLPEFEIPEAEIDTDADGLPLLDSRWSFVEQTYSLIRSKEYREGA
jgi:hypothetical protein